MTKEEIKASPVGLRFNSGKLRWGLIEYKSLEPLVQVLMFGAQKYDDHNWKKGMDPLIVLESMQRHLAAMMSGERLDPESGLPHVGHVLCNAMFYSYYTEVNASKPEKMFTLSEAAKIATTINEVVDKHKENFTGKTYGYVNTPWLSHTTTADEASNLSNEDKFVPDTSYKYNGIRAAGTTKGHYNGIPCMQMLDGSIWPNRLADDLGAGPGKPINTYVKDTTHK